MSTIGPYYIKGSQWNWVLEFLEPRLIIFVLEVAGQDYDKVYSKEFYFEKTATMISK